MGGGSPTRTDPGRVPDATDTTPLLPNGRRRGLAAGNINENRRWRAIRVLYLIMFLGAVGFSICISSIWPYLKVVDSSASPAFLGWVVASYSIGQMVASPILGFWYNVRKNAREPLVVSMVVNILANILYAYVTFIPMARKYFLLVARAFIGFGAGNVAVTRAYISGATSEGERTGALASLNIAQALGFLLGPAIQSAFVPLGYPGPVHLPFLALNLYTAPVFTSAILGIVSIIALFTVFYEHDAITTIPDTEKMSLQVGSVQEVAPSRVAVCVCIVLFFFVIFVFAVFETIGTPLSLDMFAWTNAEATLYNGIILAVAGLVASLVFVVVKVLSRRFDERKLLVAGFMLMFAGFITYLPWGNNMPPRPFIDIQPATSIATLTNTSIPEDTSFTNSSTRAPSPTSTDADNTSTGVPKPLSTDEPLGCPYDQRWCDYTPAMHLAQYLGGCLLIAVGYPASVVLATAIFSKILGSSPQGTMMGWLSASGSLARTVGPVFVTFMYDNYGPRVTFSSVAGSLLLAVAVLLIAYKTLIPFHQWQEKINNNINVPQTCQI